ncbi:hypothetical protein BH11ARM2_BH11ARM2_08040 [soil metagenome]
MPWTPAADRLPRSVRRVLERGVAEARPARVVLYGSRARGDDHATSDFDVAFSDVEEPRAWRRFRLEEVEAPNSVWPIDLVLLEEAKGPFADVVRRDAVTLYEK